MVYGQDSRVAEFVSVRAPHAEAGFEKYRAIGVEKDGELIAGVVYDQFRGNTIHVSIASTSPRWATRQVLFCLFAYPFLQLGVARLTAYTGRSMIQVRKFLERLGFVLEGVMREGFDDDDCAIYGMLKSECRWIERTPNHGKKQPLGACSA